jgi:Kef-type K+ transport system membrane component KefB
LNNINVIVVLSFLIVISPLISNITRIPIVVVEILLGSIVGYSGIFADNELLKIIAKVGLLYLMFIAGMEVNLKDFLNIKGRLLVRAFGYFITMYILSFIIYLYFNLSVVYIVALPIVSLGMIMALLKEYGKQEPWINLVLTIGVIGELISIIGMTILSGYLEYGFGLDFFQAIAILLGMVIIIILFFRLTRVIFWWFPELKTYIMPQNDNKDQDIRFSISLFFIIIAIMLYLHIYVVM